MPATATTVPSPDVSRYVDADGVPCPELVRGRLHGDKGVITLHLDCTALHALLRDLGLVVQESYQRFEAAPAGADVIDTAAHAVTARALTRVPQGRSRWSADIGAIYGHPPTVEQLRTIAASVERARDAVLAHYRPVEISIAPSAIKVAKREEGGK